MSRLWIGTVAAAVVSGGVAADEQPAAPDLDQLIDRFNAGAAPQEDEVRLDAWIEADGDRGELVVVVDPQGELKLVADPGITVTPLEQPGVEWQVALPYRRVDPETDYLTPPATIRLPFATSSTAPIEVLVEYAYCVVDYQCFFGEDTLTVALR